MFTINRGALAAELALLQSVAEKKRTIPILSCVKIECAGKSVTLTATDLDVTLITTVDSEGESWSGCVPLRQIYLLVKLLDGEHVELSEQSNQRLQIKSGSAKHLLPFTPIESFPEARVPKGHGMQIDGVILGAMIKATAFWIRPMEDGLKESEIKQTGLSVRSNGESLEVMSFRRTACAIATLPMKIPTFNMIIPRQAVAALEYLNEDLKMISGENQITFIGSTRTLCARILAGEFPAWRTFLPKYEHKVEIPESFTSALRRVAVTTREGRIWEVLKLTISKETLKLESRGGDSGQSEEVLPVTSTLNGASVEIGINGQQMAEALNRSSYNITCAFVDGEQPMIFTPASKDFELCYLTMPCRLNF